MIISGVLKKLGLHKAIPVELKSSKTTKHESFKKWELLSSGCGNCDRGTKEPQENKLFEKYKKRSCQHHKLLTCYPLSSKTKKDNQNPFGKKKKIKIQKKKFSEMSQHPLIYILSFPLRRLFQSFLQSSRSPRNKSAMRMA